MGECDDGTSGTRCFPRLPAIHLTDEASHLSFSSHLFKLWSAGGDAVRMETGPVVDDSTSSALPPAPSRRRRSSVLTGRED